MKKEEMNIAKELNENNQLNDLTLAELIGREDFNKRMNDFVWKIYKNEIRSTTRPQTNEIISIELSLVLNDLCWDDIVDYHFNKMTDDELDSNLSAKTDVFVQLIARKVLRLVLHRIKLDEYKEVKVEDLDSRELSNIFTFIKEDKKTHYHTQTITTEVCFDGDDKINKTEFHD